MAAAAIKKKGTLFLIAIISSTNLMTDFGAIRFRQRDRATLRESCFCVKRMWLLTGALSLRCGSLWCRRRGHGESGRWNLNIRLYLS